MRGFCRVGGRVSSRWGPLEGLHDSTPAPRALDPHFGPCGGRDRAIDVSLVASPLAGGAFLAIRMVGVIGFEVIRPNGMLSDAERAWRRPCGGRPTTAWTHTVRSATMSRQPQWLTSCATSAPTR